MQFGEEREESPGILLLLDMIGEKPRPVTDGAENGDFLVLPRRGDSDLDALGHPHPGYVREQVEFDFVGEPELKWGMGAQGPLFSRWSTFFARR